MRRCTICGILDVRLERATMSAIYHITSAWEAATARRSGTYVPAAFDADGFIHCSYEHQVHDVANRRFAGRSDLVLLEIDRARLTCDVVDENLEGGTDLFPHVYGPLPMSAVVRVHQFPCGADGGFVDEGDVFSTGSRQEPR
jgi:uncharacterized protein (DUF952 family)